ncbi:hypothetical protein [Bradyrhizobium oligotrophicum]|uniref:portal protein n=1 Tax=Bradyrhizobium oligotrophicum TaxID=44255 RepID=UPI003EBE8534
MDAATDQAVDIAKLRQQFEQYAGAKWREIEEQRLSWRYYYAVQYDEAQLKKLADRGQPTIVFDRIGRKIDGLVGVIRKLRTDPKAFPRTQNQEAGAEVATQVIRTICDASKFEDIESEGVLNAAVHGIAVAAQTLEVGDRGDPDTVWEAVDPRTFFYDPRSVKPDFSDARFKGTYKWASEDEILEIAPEAEGKLGNDDVGVYTSFDTDREILWRDEKGRYRLVDHWWIERGMWKWCLHVGSTVLASGETPFFNDRRKPLCKYRAFAAMIDHQGDHVGFIRRLRGPQDAMNQHRSKALHIMNTRQLKIRKGVAEEMNGGIERIRKEAARPDGVLEYPGAPEDIEIIQPQQEFLQQTQYYEDAKQEIETFGPNPALLGDLGQSASGRAYAMAQQAGLAELGPFLKNFRMWKLGIYEQSWWAAQKYWTSERFLRVTDDQGLAQFMQINALQMHPQLMQPVLVNALGSIDVDIVISEGPATETVMGDVYDTLMALAQNKVPVPPAVIIETSSLPGEVKKKLTGMMSQPDPAAEMAKKLELQGKAAANDKTVAETQLTLAKARTEGAPEAPGEEPLPPEIRAAQAMVDLRDKHASAEHKRAQAANLDAQTALAPLNFVHDVILSHQDRADRARAPTE